jgi:hypothetical protein
MTTKIVLALVCQVALASDCSSQDSQCDASVLLQSQKKVETHRTLPETMEFTVTPSDYLNSVALTVHIKNNGQEVTDGSLLVFVNNKLQGVQEESTYFPPGDKTMYDLLVYGKGAITSVHPASGQETTTAGDDGKHMSFAYLTSGGRLFKLKATTGRLTVFQPDARGCELQDDGTVRGQNHFNPLELEFGCDPFAQDGTADDMYEFMLNNHGKLWADYHFTCDQLKGWGNCDLVPGVCAHTCLCSD